MQIPFVVREADAPIDVVALGENSLDFVGTVGGADAVQAGKQVLTRFHMQPGGQMATAALACARLGVRTRYIGAFGSDDWSRLARAPLDAAGVEVVSIGRNTACRTAIILVDPSGDRAVYEHRDTTLLIEPDEIADEVITSARVLLVDATHPAAALRAAEVARRAGVVSIVDADRPSPDVDRLLQEIDVVVVPESFVRSMTGASDPADGVATLSLRYPRASIVIATRGEAGSLASCGGQLIATPAFGVEVRDTTGAGDAFRAGLAAALVGRIHPVTVEGVLRFAGATAALNCRVVGAQAGVPSLEEVEALLVGGPPAGADIPAIPPGARSFEKP